MLSTINNKYEILLSSSKTRSSLTEAFFGYISTSRLSIESLKTPKELPEKVQVLCNRGLLGIGPASLTGT
jgi:hypothetical protein